MVRLSLYQWTAKGSVGDIKGRLFALVKHTKTAALKAK